MGILGMKMYRVKSAMFITEGAVEKLAGNG
jgi:hypothetical protein